MKKILILLLIAVQSFAQTGTILTGTVSTDRNALTVVGMSLGIVATATGPYGIKGIVGLITTSGSSIYPTITGINITTSGTNANPVLIGNPAQDTYRKVGTIINESFTSSRANYSSNANFTIVSNRLQITSSASSSIGLANYITHDLYGGSNLEDYTLVTTITAGAINTTSFGVAFGMQSINGYASQSYQIGIALDATNAGRITYYYNNTATISIAGVSKLPSVSQGDKLAVKIRFLRNKIVATISNISISPVNSITESFVMSVGYPVGTYNLPSYGKYAIYGLGGTHSIAGLTISSDEIKNPDWLLIGDSNGKGYYVGNIENRFFTKISNQYLGKFSVLAAPGNRFEDNNINEITLLGASNVLVDLGTNNSGSGQSLATFQTNAISLISNLTNAGYVLGTNLFINTLLPRNSIDNTTYNTFIRTYAGNGAIDIYYAFVAASGTGFNSLYSFEGTHLNVVGNQKKADVLANAMGLLPKVEYKQETNFPVFDQGNGYLGIGRGNPRPLYNLDVNANIGESCARFGSGTSAIYMNDVNSNSAYIGIGASYDNASFVAQTPRPILMGYNGTDLIFYQNSGLTIGNTYSPTQVGSIGATANGAIFNNVGFGTLGNLWSNSTSGFLMFGGQVRTGGFIAASTSAVMIGAGTLASMSLYFNSGLTNGNSYSPTEKHRFISTGLSLGQAVDPSAYLQTAANTSSIPSIILTSSVGVNYSGSISGAMWNNGTDLAINAIGIALTTAGAGFKIKEGTNARMGVATLASGTVTINNTSITANTRIFVTVQETGTYTAVIRVSARVIGTSFTITSNTPTDNCTVAWELKEGL